MPILIQTTVDNDTAASRIIDALLEAKLSSCVHVVPIQSHYVWEGERQQSSELLLQIKASKQDYNAIEALIVKHHDYDLPEILAIDIATGYAPYLAWLNASNSTVR
ncbi:MAG: hypothetical protein KU37_07655 [Sulfuricurvum sp. PC08-66]|nr:MAG: hypothetical protein KU37_07655 [Sulfuricurvum sp. PC08-66]